jgi:YVTN family beta-propeller protein
MKTESFPLRIAVCALALSAVGVAQSPGPATVKSTTPKTALLVLSKQNHTLAIVDPADLHVVAKVPVGEDPHEVVASTDGRTAYVSNYDSVHSTRFQCWTSLGRKLSRKSISERCEDRTAWHS